MSKYCQAQINASDKKEAEKILNYLLEKRLIAGGNITHSPARYWWKGKIDRHEYYSIMAFSLMRNKNKIIYAVRQLHSDECPGIVFWRIDANRDFLEWIRQNCK